MFDNTHLYDRYQVAIQFRDRLCGGTPRNKEMIRAWIKARTGHDDDLTEAQAEEVEAAIVEAEESCWTGFMRDEHGLYVHTRNVKAMIKQCSSMLRITMTKLGSKQVLAEGTEVKASGGGDRIYLGVKEPSDSEERPIHVKTPKGDRNALKRVDYVTKPKLQFEVWVLGTDSGEKRHIGQIELEEILTFAQENGLGADRSQGEGKFDVVKFEPISKAKSRLPKMKSAKDVEASA